MGITTKTTTRGKLAALTVLVLASVVVPGQVADAHEAGNYSCTSGALCLWWDAHYLGGRYQFFGMNENLHLWAIADEDSASRNNGTSGLKARVWEDDEFKGYNTVCLAQGARKTHHYADGDKASSNDWRSVCG